jgi:hypothetical protein
VTTSTGKIWSNGLDLSRSGVATAAIVDPAAGELYADEVAKFRALSLTMTGSARLWLRPEPERSWSSENATAALTPALRRRKCLDQDGSADVFEADAQLRTEASDRARERRLDSAYRVERMGVCQVGPRRARAVSR